MKKSFKLILFGVLTTVTLLYIGFHIESELYFVRMNLFESGIDKISGKLVFLFHLFEVINNESILSVFSLSDIAKNDISAATADKILSIDPSNIYANNRKFWLLYEEKKFEETKPYYEKIKDEPIYTKISPFRQAEVLTSYTKYMDALQIYDKIISDKEIGDPLSVQAWKFRNQLLTVDYRENEISKYIEKLFDHAKSLERENKFQEAIHVYEEILTFDLYNFDAAYGLITSQIKSGYVEDSQKTFRTYFRIETLQNIYKLDYEKYVNNLLSLASLYEESPEDRTAFYIYTELNSFDHFNIEALKGLARTAEKINYQSIAIQSYERLRTLDPENRDEYQAKLDLLLFLRNK